MDKKSFLVFLNYLFHYSNIPICVLQGDDIVLQLPATAHFLNRNQPYLEALKKLCRSVSYTASPYGALYGLVHVAEVNYYIFIGPFFITPVTQDIISELLETLEIPEAETAQAKIFFNGISSGSLYHFLSFLSCLNFALNRELLTIEEIDFPMDSHKQGEYIQSAYAHTNFEARESKPLHNTYLYEMRYMDLIARGDTEGMKRALITPLPGRYGSIGNDALRQAKNVFIAACTLYTRAAITGGLGVEAAYNLSDTYIRTSESYTTVAEVERLMQKMPLDFTERVEQEVKFKNVSQPVITAIHYIREHINLPLTADEIAAQVNLSTSYFLKRFKSETGQGLSEFITHTKIDEACSLLSYTDKTLTEISNYLYFSSQSYFQNVFKKVTGYTPARYRNMKRNPVFLRPPE